jgi:mannose-6-phosphate isomerase-like protein (cupin superfamily)
MLKVNIANITEENTDFRKVVVTGVDSQLVLMCIPPGEDVGDEVYTDVDQITVVVDGRGEFTLGGETQILEAGDLVFVHSGATHSLVNVGDDDLKLYTIYAPPELEPDSVQESKNDQEDLDLLGGENEAEAEEYFFEDADRY